MNIVLHRDGRVTLDGKQVGSWSYMEPGYSLYTDHPTRPVVCDQNWQEFRRKVTDHLENTQ